MEVASKIARQGRILDLIRSQQIFTQQDLLKQLRSIGVEATQVTVSRDLHDLGIVKTRQGYQQLAVGRTMNLAWIVQEFLLSAAAAQNLVVIRTTPGNAMTVAKALDAEAWQGVVGTVAGDDTVLAVSPDSSTARRVTDKLLKLK